MPDDEKITDKEWERFFNTVDKIVNMGGTWQAMEAKFDRERDEE